MMDVIPNYEDYVPNYPNALIGSAEAKEANRRFARQASLGNITPVQQDVDGNCLGITPELWSAP